MSDLFHETAQASTGEPDASPEPARDTGASQEYETAEPAGQRYGEYTETGTNVQARIADQGEFPTREESRQATWGDNPDYYDETDLGDEYDGDIDAFLAGEDELPTPHDSRARTWGDNPEYYDETELASGYDAELGAVTAEGDSLAARHAPASPEAEDPHTGPAALPEDWTGSRAQGGDADARDQDAGSTADHQPDQAGKGLVTTELGLAHDGQASADTGTGAKDTQPDHPKLPEDDGDVLPPDTERLKALETELDAARQEIVDLEAELKAVKDEQAARLDRIEHLLATADRQPEGTDTPEHGADQPGGAGDLDSKSPTIAERKKSDEHTDTADAAPSRWRRVVSPENAGIASTLVGATGTVSDFVVHMTPEGAVGLSATALGLVSLGLAKIEKDRKGKA